MTLLVGSSLAAAIVVAVILTAYLLKRTADAGNGVGDSQTGSRLEVGQTITLSAPILAGRGRIMIGGREWLLDGPDLDAGSVVTIVAEQEGKLYVVPGETAARLPKAGTFGG